MSSVSLSTPQVWENTLTQISDEIRTMGNQLARAPKGVDFHSVETNLQTHLATLQAANKRIEREITEAQKGLLGTDRGKKTVRWLQFASVVSWVAEVATWAIDDVDAPSYTQWIVGGVSILITTATAIAWDRFNKKVDSFQERNSLNPNEVEETRKVLELIKTMKTLKDNPDDKDTHFRSGLSQVKELSTSCRQILPNERLVSALIELLPDEHPLNQQLHAIAVASPDSSEESDDEPKSDRKGSQSTEKLSTHPTTLKQNIPYFLKGSSSNKIEQDNNQDTNTETTVNPILALNQQLGMNLAYVEVGGKQYNLDGRSAPIKLTNELDVIVD